VCDTCNQWYHVSCQSMSSNTYLEHANDSAVAWDCIMCNCPNFSTFCYSKAFSTSNQYSILSDISLNSPGPSERLKPIHISTPERTKHKGSRQSKNKTLKILNINFQSFNFQRKSRYYFWDRNLDRQLSQGCPNTSWRI
jgi:hypothetical protein